MCHKFWLCQLFLCTYLLLWAPFHDRNFHNHATDTSLMGIVTFFWHGCAIKSKPQTEMVYEHRQRMSLEWKHKCTCLFFWSKPLLQMIKTVSRCWRRFSACFKHPLPHHCDLRRPLHYWCYDRNLTQACSSSERGGGISGGRYESTYVVCVGHTLLSLISNNQCFINSQWRPVTHVRPWSFIVQLYQELQNFFITSFWQSPWSELALLFA